MPSSTQGKEGGKGSGAKPRQQVLIWLFIFLPAIALFTLTLVFFIKKNEADQDAYWRAEKLRRLGEVARTIEASISTLPWVLQHSLVRYGYCASEPDDSPGDCPYLESYNRAIALYDLLVFERGASSASDCGPVEDPYPVQARARLIDGQLKFCLIKDIRNQDGKIMRGEARVNFHEILADADISAFDALYLTTNAEKQAVSFRTNQDSFIGFKWMIDIQEKPEKPSDRAFPISFAGEFSPKAVAPSNVAPFTHRFSVGKRDFLAFSYPLRPPVQDRQWLGGGPYQTVNYDEELMPSHIVGIIEEERFRDQFRPPLILGSLGLVLLILLVTAAPFLKMVFIGKRDMLSRTDAAMLAFSACLMAGLLTITFVTTISDLLVGRFLDDRLFRLSHQIEHNFIREVGQYALDLLHLERQAPDSRSRLALSVQLAHQVKSDFALYGGCLSKNKADRRQVHSLAGSLMRENGRPRGGEEVFWLSKRGCFLSPGLTNNRSVMDFPVDPVLSRHYFTGLRDGALFQLAQLAMPLVLERIWSRPTNRKLTAISLIKKDEDALGLVAFDHLFSVYQPLMPFGTGFAIIENGSFRTLYHSDDRRSLTEQPRAEFEPLREMEMAMRTGSDILVSGYYRGVPHSLYMRQMNGLPWTIITFQDHSLTSLTFFQTISIATAIFVVYLIVMGLLIFLLERTLDKQAAWLWLWPRINKRTETDKTFDRRFIWAVVLYSLISLFILLMITGWWGIAFIMLSPLVLWAGTRLWLRKKGTTLTGTTTTALMFLFLINMAVLPAFVFASNARTTQVDRILSLIHLDAERQWTARLAHIEEEINLARFHSRKAPDGTGFDGDYFKSHGNYLAGARPWEKRTAQPYKERMRTSMRQSISAMILSRLPGYQEQAILIRDTAMKSPEPGDKGKQAQGNRAAGYCSFLPRLQALGLCLPQGTGVTPPYVFLAFSLMSALLLGLGLYKLTGYTIGRICALSIPLLQIADTYSRRKRAFDRDHWLIVDASPQRLQNFAATQCEKDPSACRLVDLTRFAGECETATDALKNTLAEIRDDPNCQRIYLSGLFALMGEVKKRGLVLHFLEELVLRSEGKAVTLLSPAFVGEVMKDPDTYPLYRHIAGTLSLPERSRWQAVFSRMNQAFGGTRSTDSKESDDPLRRECAAFPELDVIERHLRALGNTTDPDTIVHMVGEHAEAFYTGIWRRLSSTQRLILHQLAKGRFINAASWRDVHHLHQLGLIERQPHFAIVNESFAGFARDAESDQTFQGWRNEGGKSLWSTLRLPIGLVLLALIAIVAVAAGPLHETMLAVIAAIAGLMPVINQLKPVFTIGKGGT